MKNNKTQRKILRMDNYTHFSYTHVSNYYLFLICYYEYLGSGLKGNRVIPIGSKQIHCEPPINYNTLEGRRER